MQLRTVNRTVQSVSPSLSLRLSKASVVLVVVLLPFRLLSQPSGLYYNQPLVVAAGEQTAPIPVGDDQAGAFVVWPDKRDGRMAIYAQHLNSQSQPMWKQDGVAVAVSLKEQLAPVAISDSKGGVLIFWQDRRNDDGDIFGQHLDSDGNLLWGASGAPVIRANGKQSEPLAVSDGQGGAFVLCRDFSSSKEDILAQRIDGNAKVFLDATGKSLAPGNGLQVLGDVAATADGGFVVAWNDNLTGLSRVLTQRYDAEANPQWLTSAFVASVRSTQTAPKVYVPMSANDTRGSAYVVWVDNRNHHFDLYAQKFDANGLPQWGLLGAPICQAANDQYNQQIVGDGSEGLLLVWEDKRSGKADVYGQAVNAAGQVRWNNDGVAIAASSQEQTQPSLIADGSGGLICAWSDDRGTGTNILAQHLDKNGKALWTANGIFVTNESGNKQRPAIIAMPGNFLGTAGSLVTWDDTRRGNADIFVQALRDDGTLANVPPRIVSSPVTEAQEGSLYTYQVQAIDYDSADPLGLELLTPANGTWLQAGNAKLQLSGTPSANDTGTVAVTLAVQDKLGASATQSFTIKVLAAANRPPQITSTPDTIAVEDQLYSYKIVATDSDPGDMLTFAMETNATWLQLTKDGKISGTPRNEHVGSFTVTLRATDKKGATATQKFSLRVKNVNDPPFFTSQPDTIAYVDSLYIYRPAVADVDRGDVAQIFKRAAPEWLSWNTSTRTLQGKPSLQYLGTTALVTLLARDAASASTEQSFPLIVLSNNHPPQITSKPDTVAIEDQLYSYIIAAADPDPGDALTLALDTDATWLQLTNDGKITGTPKNEHVGSFTVTVRVTDKQHAVATQNFSIQVKNVNDPPFFTSEPDTFAYIDSLYVYQVSAADVDLGDAVQISKSIAPEWLSWNTNTQTLQGNPTVLYLGAAFPVTLLARDVSGATAEQSFRLRVSALGAPDTIAPSAPRALQIQPANWSATKKFTLRWQNPSDPSRIAGAFYKIGAPPANARDGVFVSNPGGATINQLELLVPQEGKWPIYLWLMDGRHNVDHRTAAQVTYRYDATPPPPPQNLYPQRQWSRNDSVRFQWTPASDTVSGIRRYHFFLDDKFFGYLPGDANNFLLILQLVEKNYAWALMAEDSAGNLGAKTTATFAVDRRPPILSHAATDTAAALTELTISTQAQDALSGVREVQLHYRAVGEPAYHAKNFQVTNWQPTGFSTFLTHLDAAEVVAKGLEYYLEAVDSAGNRTRWPIDYPHAVITASAKVAAPAPLAAGHYQIFSAPYRLLDGSPAAWLEDDLGSYDQTAWRLFRYQPGDGNVEFGKPNFENFAPGRAYWLITTTPQSYDTGPAHSVSTDVPFALALQPGWNLISTPFDFPTAWSAVQRPAGVENNLWAFDGTRYFSQQDVLSPWQGCFLRNLEAQPQTIFIAPVVAGNNVAKPKSSDAEIFWQVQLHVSDGKFRDDENYLGAAAASTETWDAHDLSEPPAIGDYVSLYFDRRNWPRYAGLFTSDFRPADSLVQKWDFTVVATRTGLPVELTWEFSGVLPKAWTFVLEDVDGHLRHRIQPEEMSSAGDHYVFRATATPPERHFIWWAGREERLLEAGAFKNIVPETFELAPSYPNPLRPTGFNATGTIATIRLGLPIATAVRLTIFDLAGRVVRTLVAAQSMGAGYHEARWDGADDHGRPVAAGIYIYRLETANFVASRKLILLR